jgi:hypothetical protein
MSLVPAEARDVRIRRCTVRVVRRGGWSWGPEPAAMAAAVARALPALIAEELAGLVGERAGTAVQRTPVKVKLRVTRAELAALAASVPPGATLPPRHASQGPLDVHADAAALPAALRAGLRGAVAAALASPDVVAGWRAEPPASHAPIGAAPAVDDARETERDGAAGGGVLATLGGWLDDGILAGRLAATDDAALEAWERALLAPLPAAERPAGATDAAIDRVVGAAVAALADRPRSRLAEARLTVVLAAHRALGVAPGNATLRAAVERHLRAADTGAPLAVPAPPPARESRAIGRTLASDDEHHIATALPFLALGALARLGWLGAAVAFLHADAQAGPTALAAFATALAHKLGAAPGRGWRRSSAAAAAAACFVGRADPLSDRELAWLAALLEDRTSAFDDAARRPFLDGHVTGDPLVVVRARHAERDGWLLAEARGAFVLAWAPELHGLEPTLAALADELVLVPSAAATPEALAWLDALGRAFVTDAIPSRGEPWRALYGESAPRLHANPCALDHSIGDRAVLSAGVPAEARDLAACAERITAAWHAIAVDRPAAPRAPQRGLDASLSLAASLALADIAWQLFRTREPTDARLALDRFADLDAHVRVTPDEVRVRLPLGRRYQHLREHGLLADISRVPWWAGRAIVFSGG